MAKPAERENVDESEKSEQTDERRKSPGRKNEIRDKR